MKKILATIVLTVLVLPAVALGQGNPPSLPLLVYGNVSLYGVTPPAGMEISVLKNGVIIATTTVNNAGKYFFQIPASYTGSTLTYKIGTSVATEKVCLNPLLYASDNINLTIVAPSVPSGGGGGGGGGGIITPPANPVTDMTGDGKVDVLDFVVLMANWGSVTAGSTGDFNSDGRVDILDFVTLMANWTQ